MSELRLSLLGPPQIELKGKFLYFQRRKTLALLIYLAVTGQPQPRNTLATLLWPDSSQSLARASLSRELSLLSQALGQGWLITDRERVRLSRQPELWLDVEEFQRYLKKGQNHDHPPTEPCPACLELLDAAVSLYRNDFLAGFSLQDCPEFDDWQLFQGESLRLALAAALERLVRGYYLQQNHEVAITYARRWLALDPLNEAAHRALIQLYLHTDQFTAALRQYQLCLQILEAELGLSPADETVALYEQIRTRVLKPVPTPAFISRPPHNLPVPLTPFIGREKELTEIIARLRDPSCRLLTLLGPGGIGKTRLAIQAAQQMLESSPEGGVFSDGLYFIPLTAVSSPDFLISTLTGALHFVFYDEVEPKQQLLNYLREKSMLLILDNFEHLLEGTSLISDILEAAPAVKIIVTSREILDLYGEWLYPVEGLLYPEDHEVETQSFEAYGAIQLFNDCADRVQPNFSLSIEREHVIRICRLVEGNPLAIELAGAWLKTLSCAQIAQEIEANFDFLKVSFRNLPDRHRSMRVVFEYSWQLLSEAERQLFRRLSIFRGGFWPEAAEQIAAVSLSTLVILVEKSLLHLTSQGRYHLHELLRQFAAEKLQAFPKEQEQTQDRHADYYLAFLHRQEPRLAGQERRVALAEIEEEIENIRAAWEWAVACNKIDQITGALSSLYNFYYTRSWFQEGKTAFEKAAEGLQILASALPTNTPDDKTGKELEFTRSKSWETWGRLLARQAAFNEALGLYDPAGKLAQQSLAIARHLEAGQEIAFSLYVLGRVIGQKDLLAAKQLYQESLVASQAYQDETDLFRSLIAIGDAIMELGERSEAKAFFEQSLAFGRKYGHPEQIAQALDKVAIIALLDGKYGEAIQYYQESLSLFREFGDQSGVAHALTGLGWAAWWEGGQVAEAKLYLAESLAIYEKMGRRLGAAFILALLGGVANSLGEYQVAQQHHQEALRIAQAYGSPIETFYPLRGLAETTYHLGEFQAARHYLYQALKVAVEIHAFPLCLEALEIWTRILVKEAASTGAEKTERAYQLLHLILNHPATTRYRRDNVTKLLAELETKGVASQRQSKVQDLPCIVAEALAELER